MPLRDQIRAKSAYHYVGEISDKDFDEYKTAVHAFGSNILRSGLAAAIADLQRRGTPASVKLLGQLPQCHIPGVAEAHGMDFPARVRNLEVDEYILATRECLKLAVWFKRAIQARKQD